MTPRDAEAWAVSIEQTYSCLLFQPVAAAPPITESSRASGLELKRGITTRLPMICLVVADEPAMRYFDLWHAGELQSRQNNFGGPPSFEIEADGYRGVEAALQG